MMHSQALDDDDSFCDLDSSQKRLSCLEYCVTKRRESFYIEEGPTMSVPLATVPAVPQPP